jgi:hypothetical protein
MFKCKLSHPNILWEFPRHIIHSPEMGQSSHIQSAELYATSFIHLQLELAFLSFVSYFTTEK